MNPAPHFTLRDQNDTPHTLDDYAGKWLVLYFYPKDETPGCTAEACAFRDGRDALQAAGAEVVGVSADSVASHQQFAEGHGLNFTLLSDESLNTIKAYGAWGKKTVPGSDTETEGTLRKTFLITPDGQIAKEYPAVDPAGHASQVLADLEALRENA